MAPVQVKRRPDFWQSSGFGLLAVNGDGRLDVTDDFLRAFLLRPELAPEEESDDTELSLHASLLEDPARAVGPAELASLSDPDARENYQVFLAFRDRLLEAGTIEACYLDLFRRPPDLLPALFVDQLVHVIARSMLDDATDPFRVRAAELLFREQTVEIQPDAVLLADVETVEMTAQTAAPSTLAAPDRPAEVQLDILNADVAADYWDRSERFDFVLDIALTQPGLYGLCRVLEQWVAHLFAVRVRINQVQRIADERWRWHIGLDEQASALLDTLYAGDALSDDDRYRILSLFELEFEDPSVAIADMEGRPVYLALAMDSRQRLRVKPQNLLFNLPLATRA